MSEATTYTVHVDDDKAGGRLDKVLTVALEGFSRTRVQALIAEGHVHRDGEPATDAATKVRPGDVWVVQVPPPTPAAPWPMAIPLDVVFEDDHLIVVDKPAGMVVHPAAGHADDTLVNALLAEVAQTGDRVVLIEDTRELQCAAPNLVALRTKDGSASLTDLVRSALRLRPDRIPIGEVRGAEALDLLKAWGTGHPGGIGTIHAGSALGTLRRLEQLIQESVVTVPRALIAETIDVIAVLVRDGAGRRLAELAKVRALDASGEYVLVPLPHTQGDPS